MKADNWRYIPGNPVHGKAPWDGGRVILGFYGIKDVVQARWRWHDPEAIGWYSGGNKIKGNPTHWQPWPDPPEF